jgi:hypothetical protein
MRSGTRKRSATITLVLAGSAALGGCGSPAEQRDAYASRQDCLKDWSEPVLCEPVRDGRYASSYFYGPPYYASSGWNFFGRDRIVPSRSAADAVQLPKGTVATAPSSLRARTLGFSGGGSAGISRGGFGSSAHASSGG